MSHPRVTLGDVAVGRHAGSRYPCTAGRLQVTTAWNKAGHNDYAACSQSSRLWRSLGRASQSNLIRSMFLTSPGWTFKVKA